jgi:hypothetical protein
MSRTLVALAASAMALSLIAKDAAAGGSLSTTTNESEIDIRSCSPPDAERLEKVSRQFRQAPSTEAGVVVEGVSRRVRTITFFHGVDRSVVAGSWQEETGIHWFFVVRADCAALPAKGLKVIGGLQDGCDTSPPEGPCVFDRAALVRVVDAATEAQLDAAPSTRASAVRDEKGIVAERDAPVNGSAGQWRVVPAGFRGTVQDLCGTGAPTHGRRCDQLDVATPGAVVSLPAEYGSYPLQPCARKLAGSAVMWHSIFCAGK